LQGRFAPPSAVRLRPSLAMVFGPCGSVLPYHSALGSARELLACLETAIAFGYIEEVRVEIMPRMNRILGTLTNLAR
jgi:hypothetical protein